MKRKCKNRQKQQKPDKKNTYQKRNSEKSTKERNTKAASQVKSNQMQTGQIIINSTRFSFVESNPPPRDHTPETLNQSSLRPPKAKTQLHVVFWHPVLHSLVLVRSSSSWPGGLSMLQLTFHLVEKQSTRAANHPCVVFVGARCFHAGRVLAACSIIIIIIIIIIGRFSFWNFFRTHTVMYFSVFVMARCNNIMVCRTLHCHAASYSKRNFEA